MTSEEHEDPAWLKVATVLGVDPNRAEIRREIQHASWVWQDYKTEDFAPSAELREELFQISEAARQLASKGERVRRHIRMQLLLSHNNISFSKDEEDNPFADAHLSAVRLMGELCQMLGSTMTTTRGPKGDITRRAAWLRATEIYETVTGIAASFSRSADQQIYGRWVSFIQAFSALAMPDHEIEPGAIESFHRYRAKRLKDGGHPLTEAYFGV